MGKNITLTVPDSVYAVMKSHPEINWSNVSRRAIEAFASMLSKAESAEEEIKKNYGNDVAARLSFGINETSAQSKNPAEDGMLSSYYNFGINFNASVQPTRHGITASSKKKILEDITKNNS
jgi:hypothetical protein